mmetsp:Transcript_98981/g.317419  ORF Transcript_98981/g.317419 Transcript_98981/m.317419 type:complete len:238 (+) Transcript_98981:1501-2214(+)
MTASSSTLWMPNLSTCSPAVFAICSATMRRPKVGHCAAAAQLRQSRGPAQRSQAARSTLADAVASRCRRSAACFTSADAHSRQTPRPPMASRPRILQVPQTGRSSRCSGPAETPPADTELMELGRGTRRSHAETSTGTMPEMPWLRMREIAGSKAFSAYHQRSNLEDAPPNAQPSATPEGATQRSTNLAPAGPHATTYATRSPNSGAAAAPPAAMASCATAAWGGSVAEPPSSSSAR